MFTFGIDIFPEKLYLENIFRVAMIQGPPVNGRVEEMQ
jgi:hypothetical protein